MVKPHPVGLDMPDSLSEIAHVLSSHRDSGQYISHIALL
jgi:hypothetical protein